MQKIMAYCEKKHMFEEGDGVVLGLSGGADSVCLFMVLLELRARWKLKILAVHVHHGIRGEAADRDAAFSRALCQRYDVEYVEERADIPALAKELHMTEEEAGRYTRYQCFQRLLLERGYEKIAVAHHKNDQAETILFHMARGTGVDGMVGMRPVAGRIVRPLLCVTRQEIEALLAKCGESYCNDDTNADVAYTRNYMRHEVIPRLEQVNAEAVPHIAALSEKVSMMQEYLQENIETAYIACRRKQSREGVTLSLQALSEQHPYIRQAVARRAVMELTDSLKDIEQVHIDMVLHLIKSQSGRRVMLPYGIVVWRGGDELYFQQNKPENGTIDGWCTINVSEMACGQVYTFSLSPANVLTAEVLEEKPDIIGKKRYTKYFDCDKIKGNLVLRHPEPEDYLVIDSAGHRKKLNRYFVDEKLPVYERESQMVLADGHHILWVPGYRISEAYKVTPQTSRVVRLSLILQIEEGEVNDRED